MKLDIDFTNLEKLVKNMGASSVDWISNVVVSHVETDWKIVLETKGLDVDIKDIEIQLNGLLQYRGEQILLYIKEINGVGHYSLPKFHFYQCATLNNMQSKGRFERYVVTQRKTGYFLMDKKISYDLYDKGVEERLDVCKNCLNWYNKNYRKRYSVGTFDIVEFFEHFIKSPINQKPVSTDILSSTSIYPGRLKSELKKPTFDNANKLQKSYTQSDISPIPTNDFNSPSKSVSENYVEILPIITQTTSVELDIDESTQNFEDMF